MAYTNEWYRKNRDRILAERRKRYREDPAYREAAKRRSKLAAERRKQQRRIRHGEEADSSGDQDE